MPKSPYGGEDLELILGTNLDAGEVRVPVKALDKHAHYIGMSGEGKSFGLYRLFQELASKTKGTLVYLDWRGEAYEFLKRWCYQKSLHRCGRLILIDPREDRLIPGLNPLRPWPGNLIAQAEAMAEVVVNTIEDESGDRAQAMQWTANLLYLLLANDLTLYEAMPMLGPDSRLRDAAISKLPSSVISGDWQILQQNGSSVEKMGHLNELLGPVIHHIRRYVTNPTVARMLASPVVLDWVGEHCRRAENCPG